MEAKYEINAPPPPSYSFTIRHDQPISTIHPHPMLIPLSDYPTACVCPYCHQSIVTRIEKSNGAMVWLMAGTLCLLGFALGCCLLPFCIDDMKDKIHYCPKCNGIIGEKKRL